MTNKELAAFQLQQLINNDGYSKEEALELVKDYLRSSDIDENEIEEIVNDLTSEV